MKIPQNKILISILGYALIAGAGWANGDMPDFLSRSKIDSDEFKGIDFKKLEVEKSPDQKKAKMKLQEKSGCPKKISYKDLSNLLNGNPLLVTVPHAEMEASGEQKTLQVKVNLALEGSDPNRTNFVEIQQALNQTGFVQSFSKNAALVAITISERSGGQTVSCRYMYRSKPAKERGDIIYFSLIPEMPSGLKNEERVNFERWHQSFSTAIQYLDPQKIIDAYETLGLKKGASLADLTKVYRSLALKLHPDKGGDPEQFKKVQAAYHLLNDNSMPPLPSSSFKQPKVTTTRTAYFLEN
jgi:hypothetical protein